MLSYSKKTPIIVVENCITLTWGTTSRNKILKLKRFIIFIVKTNHSIEFIYSKD